MAGEAVGAVGAAAGGQVVYSDNTPADNNKGLRVAVTGEIGPSDGALGGFIDVSYFQREFSGGLPGAHGVNLSAGPLFTLLQSPSASVKLTLRPALGGEMIFGKGDAESIAFRPNLGLQLDLGSLYLRAEGAASLGDDQRQNTLYYGFDASVMLGYNFLKGVIE